MGAPAAWAGRWHGADVALVAATLVGLVLRLYQLTRPGFLSGVTEYDDGVYFGSAIRLVGGALPYRDFVMVQPPGITWLMAPLALLAKATTTSTGFSVARALTAVAGGAGVPLAGLLVRHRGPAATVVTCGILAVSPAGVNAAHTLLLEPWLVLFCLLGALAMFDGNQIDQRPRRLVLAGAAFGFAAAIKLWAVAPALVILVLCRHQRAWARYAGGLAAGFGTAVIPMAALAPRSLARDVIAAQFARIDGTRISVWDRLANLTGLSAFDPVSRGVVVAVALAIVLFVGAGWTAASRRHRQRAKPLESFALATAVLVLVAFLWPPDYYLHYGWFFAPFLALSLGLAVTHLSPSASAVPTRGRRGAGYLVTALALGLVAVMAIVQLRQEARLRGDDSPVLVRAMIPAGACVLTDIPSLTIVSNRFVSDAGACPTIADPIGTDYALSGGHNGITGAGRVAAVERVWLTAFEHAGYVWLSCGAPTDPRCKTNRRVAWTPPLVAYLARHFKPLPTAGATQLYVRASGADR